MDLMVIAGPTACGKTSTGIALAKKLNGEVISGDSMQVYRHMDIGTAKVSLDEMQGVAHHLIDIIDPDEPFSAASFKQRATACIAEIQGRGKLPILVGGSGFYISALLGGIQFDETSTNLVYRNELCFLETQVLFQLLKEKDPVYARLNQTNKARLVRGLEYFHATGKKISDYIEEQKKQPKAYHAQVFILDLPREALYHRINQRVELMMGKGLVLEVEKLLQMGYNRNLTSLSSIGYKEIIAYLQDGLPLDQAVEAIKQNTRRFAKRQLTWFRNKTEGTWITSDELLYRINSQEL